MKVTSLPVEIPETGQLTPINEFVYWLRMPLPFDLDHINLYLIKDDGGWAILDTGLGSNKTGDIWDQILRQIEGNITRIIVTHMHPDHIGMAGHLVDKFKVDLYMSFSEYFTARALVAGPRGADNWQDIDYLRKCGMDEEYIARATEGKGGIGSVVKPIPLQFKRLSEGQILKMAGIEWKVMIGRGHSPEHVCLFAPSINTLISGDHILPKITPNIGAYSTEPEANPLALYLETIRKFSVMSDDVIALPAHKRPFKGIKTRVNELAEHHDKHLNNLLKFCATPRSVKDCMPVMFNRPLNPHNMFFAIAEALSHLNYLYYDKKIQRTIDEQGHWRFKAI